MAEKAVKKKKKTSPPAKGAGGARAVPPSMVDDVRQFVQLMIDNDLGELDVSEGDRRIYLKRGGEAPAAAPGGGEAMTVHPVGDVPEDKYTPAQQGDEEAKGGLIDITSPMVGTFYTASSPDTDPFVAAGDVVGTEDVVCIIEAMKVMNEIRADCAGVIAEVCVKNAQPVEYGQPLFRVKPA